MRRLTVPSGAFVLALVALVASLVSCPGTAKADRLMPTLTSTDGSACTRIADAVFSTTEHFDAGTKITLTCDEAIDALYVLWEYVPGPWVLEVGDEEYGCGKDGYLHEYVKLPKKARGATEATIVIPPEGATIADVYALSAGPLPDFVQVWEPAYEEADILFLSTHADDECLFFGGAIPTYCNKPDVRVQVAYFCDFWRTEPYRNHEILNGLWVMGVTHYPQLGEFVDVYSETYDQAAAIYDYADSLEYAVRTIRRFKPQVLVGQDILAGEYGHGAHIWSATMLADALEPAADKTQYKATARRYGTWDVPKTYFHLYPEKGLELDARVPLGNLGGATALELAKASYQEHLSQQYTWFYVDDGYDDAGNPNGYAYSCTKYGLYRSLVGDDTGKQDLLEHLTTYDEQTASKDDEKDNDESDEKAPTASAGSKETDAASAAARQDAVDAREQGNGPTSDSQPSGVRILLLYVGGVVLLVAGASVVLNLASRRRRRPVRHGKRTKRRAATPSGRARRTKRRAATPSGSAQRAKRRAATPSGRTQRTKRRAATPSGRTRHTHKRSRR